MFAMNIDTRPMKQGSNNTDERIVLRLKYLRQKAKPKETVVRDALLQGDEIKVTKHAYKRARQRLKWKRDTLDRMMGKVFVEGLKPSAFSGVFGRYIRKKLNKGGVANHLMIHGEVLFFFKDSVLITVYKVPSKFSKCLRREGSFPLAA